MILLSEYEDLVMNKDRIKWIDICKAIAIIFVFVGHWNCLHFKVFSNAFHLKLFFLLSGIFACKAVEKYKFKDYFINKCKHILIPMFIWMFIGILISNFDKFFNIHDLIFQLKDIRHIYPNWWFFPAIFTISILYYFMKKIFKKNFLVLIVSYLLLIIFGKYGIFGSIVSKICSNNLLLSYVYLEAFIAYVFWFSLGAFLFPIINKFISNKNNSKINNISFHSIGIISILISSVLFLYDIDKVGFIQNHIVNHNFLLVNYTIVTSFIIIISVIYISTFFENSKLLENIGKTTMAHMGLEFIVKDLLILYIVPLFKIQGELIPTSSMMIFVIIQFIICHFIIKYIITYFPILNGEWKKKKEIKES